MAVIDPSRSCNAQPDPRCGPARLRRFEMIPFHRPPRLGFWGKGQPFWQQRKAGTLCIKKLRLGSAFEFDLQNSSALGKWVNYFSILMKCHASCGYKIAQASKFYRLCMRKFTMKHVHKDIDIHDLACYWELWPPVPLFVRLTNSLGVTTAHTDSQFIRSARQRTLH